MSSDNRDSAVFVRSYRLDGVEFAHGIASASNGDLYVTRGHSIYLLAKDRISKLYAGSGTRKYGFKDGPLLEALFKCPMGILVTSDDTIYICDHSNHRIRVIRNGVVATFAGSGSKGLVNCDSSFLARFNSPSHILEKSGVFYVTDSGNKCLRTIQPNGSVSAILDSNVCPQHIPKKRVVTELAISSPTGIAVSPNGKKLVFSDQWTHTLFSVSEPTPSDEGSASSDSKPELTKYAGEPKIQLQGGHRDSSIGLLAQFSSPMGMTFDRYGNLLVCDRNNHSIRLIDTQGAVSTIVGRTQRKKDGPINEALTSSPTDICTLPNGDVAWVEKEGSVRIMTWSCRRSISLVAILKDPRYGNISVQQQSTAASFSLNDQIIGFHHNIDIEKLKKVIEEANVPPESITHFLSLWYGSPYQPSKEMPTQESAAIFVYLMVLTKALGATGWEDQMHWLEELFDKYCHLLPSDTLYSLLVNEAHHGLDHEPIADILVSNLQTRRFHEDHPLSFHKVKFDGHPAPVRELMLSKLGSPKPLTFTRSVHSSGAPLLRAIGIGLATLELSPGDWSISIASMLPDSSSESKPSSNSNGDTSKPSNTTSKFTVHEWLAYLRWPFFRRLLHSGLREAEQKTIELPSEFPPRLLANIISCIYRGNVDARMKKMEISDCDFALSNAAEYGLCDPLTGTISPTFLTLFRSIQSIHFGLENPGLKIPNVTAIFDPKSIPVPPSTQEWFDLWQKSNASAPEQEPNKI